LTFETEKYNPRPETREYLDKVCEIIDSSDVPYTLRGLFYVLLQDPDVSGIKTKNDWRRFKAGMSTARKRGYGSLRPWSLVDETRPVVFGGHGPKPDETGSMFLDAINQIRFSAAHWDHQPIYGEVWTESRGAAAQVAGWFPGITVRGLGGDGSIPENWDATERLYEGILRHQKPPVVFTIGDLDEKGEAIPVSALKIVNKWIDFHHIGLEVAHVRVGLTYRQVLEYEIPDKVEGTGYEWEAVSHLHARRIIGNALGEYIDFQAMAQAQREVDAITETLRAKAISNIG